MAIDDGTIERCCCMLLLALSPPSTSVSSDYVSVFLNYTYNTLPCWGLGLVDWPFTWWTDQLLSFSALTLLVGSSDP